MDQDFTLPRLQSMLDDLPDGRRIALARTQVDALFGLNDVGATRLMRFAEGHKCERRRRQPAGRQQMRRRSGTAVEQVEV